MSDELIDVKRRVLARNPEWRESRGENIQGEPVITGLAASFEDGLRVELSYHNQFRAYAVRVEDRVTKALVYNNYAEPGSPDYEALKAWFEGVRAAFKSGEALQKLQRKLRERQQARSKFFG